jgi:hypothetical protein
MRKVKTEFRKKGFFIRALMKLNYREASAIVMPQSNPN